jgi:hypothetical protein
MAQIEIPRTPCTWEERRSWLAHVKADRRLRSTPKRVLELLLDRTNNTTGACYPSIAYLADRLGLDPRSVVLALQRLVERGLVTWTMRIDQPNGRRGYDYAFPGLLAWRCGRVATPAETAPAARQASVPTPAETAATPAGTAATPAGMPSEPLLEPSLNQETAAGRGLASDASLAGREKKLRLALADSFQAGQGRGEHAIAKLLRHDGVCRLHLMPDGGRLECQGGVLEAIRQHDTTLRTLAVRLGLEHLDIALARRCGGIGATAM